MKVLLTKETLLEQISTLLDKNPPNVKTKFSQLLHRAKNHIEKHKDYGNTVLAYELKKQVDICFGFLNSGVIEDARLLK